VVDEVGAAGAVAAAPLLQAMAKPAIITTIGITHILKTGLFSIATRGEKDLPSGAAQQEYILASALRQMSRGRYHGSIWTLCSVKTRPER
jgi:hypothetical protein